MIYSLIIPVYKNEETIPKLIRVLNQLNDSLNDNLEVVFVVDGSPDESFRILKQSIADYPFKCKLIAHSRNYGSFAAIRTGLSIGTGDYFSVMAADLQEPSELVIDFYRSLANKECDVVIGTRESRGDPLLSRLTSKVFWGLYRRFVVKDIPEGGVDIFGCNRKFRNQLLKLNESRSSLISLVFWLGFDRKYIAYKRLERTSGKSGWTFRKKIDYMLDSIFSFTEYPIRLLTKIGFIGCLISLFAGILVLIGHLTDTINVPGYAAIMLALLFFGALNIFGIGVVGEYAWRSYENSKCRPYAVVAVEISNYPDNDHGQ